MIFSHGKSDARGVLISFCEAVKYKIKARYVDKNGRYIVLDVLLIDNSPGDFYLVFDVDLDADGGSPKPKVKSLSKLLSMMSENDLCDLSRIRNPEAKRFKSPFKQKRLDFFLVSDTLQENIKAVAIIPSVQSDHFAITLPSFGELKEKGVLEI